jgi:hypothetical protein
MKGGRSDALGSSYAGPKVQGRAPNLEGEALDPWGEV